MKNLLLTFILILFATISFGQKLISGEYDGELRLAYDSKTNKLTGYYENGTGWDEKTQDSRFHCIFYIEGTVTGNTVSITTYFPEDSSDDIINGTLKIINNKTVTIKLPEEHGGCWNVQHFADKPEEFKLDKPANYFQIRYISTAKTYFYKEKSEAQKMKSYLIKGDVVYVEKIEDEWALCSYSGKKTIKAWLKIADLNKL